MPIFRTKSLSLFLQSAHICLYYTSSLYYKLWQPMPKHEGRTWIMQKSHDTVLLSIQRRSFFSYLKNICWKQNVLISQVWWFVFDYLRHGIGRFKWDFAGFFTPPVNFMAGVFNKAKFHSLQEIAPLERWTGLQNHHNYRESFRLKTSAVTFSRILW